MNLRQLKKKVRKVAGCSSASGFRLQDNGAVFGAVFVVNKYLYFYRLRGPKTSRYKQELFGGRVLSLGYACKD